MDGLTAASFPSLILFDMDERDPSAGQAPSQPSPQGLTVLVNPEVVTLDLVFVHGFTGHPQHTWTHKGEHIADDQCDASREGNEHPSKYRRLLAPATLGRNGVCKAVYWPQDLVPVTLPNARVLTYGYDTKIRHRLDAPMSKSTLYDISQDLLVSLEAERRSAPLRPLVFVAHSLGGIVVKEVLRRSHSFQTHQSQLHGVFESMVGMLFFGTPHSGADPRSFTHHVAGKLGQAAGFALNEQIVNTLLPNSERLRELRDEFSPMAHQKKWIVYSFQEQYGVLALFNKQVVEDTSSTMNDPLIEITQRIARNHMEMCRFKGLEDVEYKKVASALLRISDMATTKLMQPGISLGAWLLHDKTPGLAITPKQRQGYLAALKFPQINDRLLNIKKAHDRTCTWLLEQDEYRSWLDPNKSLEHHGFLWVKGKPGAGKSTMMKYALEHTRKEIASSVIISFFFNARGEALERSTLGMYRSLLFQLLTAIPDLQELFPLPTSTKPKDCETYVWDTEGLKTIFVSAIQNLGHQHLICFIDALDECKESQVRDMVGFLEHLAHIAVSSGIRLNIYLSSRPYPHISIEKGILFSINGQQGHAQDIAKYVNSKLKVGCGKKVDEIKAKILSRSSGVFLWVMLVVQTLNTAYDHGQIHALQARLEEIPNELDDLFADILTRDNENREEVILCLQWILYAQRPMRPPELYFAILSGIETADLTEWDYEEVTIQVMERFILSCSKGLAEVTKTKDQTVQFIHESVREWLVREQGLSKLQSDLGSNIDGLSQERLKQCCYKYITTDMFQHLHLNTPLPIAPSEKANDLRILDFDKFPFLEYAVDNMLNHADNAEGYNVAQEAFLESLSLDAGSGLKALDNF